MRTRLKPGLLLIGAATVVAGVLRLIHLDRASFWLDEIIDYDAATKLVFEPWWRWLTGFGREHGPLFFATQLTARIFSTPEVAGRIAPALLGVATIPLIALAARAMRANTRTAIIAATLLAVSPLHVYYSREARPYGLLMLLATVALTALLADIVWLFVLAMAAAAYTTGVSGPLVVAAGATAVLAALLSRDPIRRRRFALSAAGCVAVACLVRLLYHETRRTTADFPPLNARFFNELAQTFALHVLGPFEVRPLAYLVLLLTIIGALALLRRDRVTGAIVIAFAVGPIAIGLGALAYLKHWYNVRYICSALPAYLLLAAAGADFICSLLRRPVLATAAASVLVVALGAAMWPAARTESYRKLDWRTIAAVIWRHAAPGDTVLTTNGWTVTSLEFYLRQLPPRVEIANAADSMAIAGHFIRTHSPLWIVNAGYDESSPLPSWSCYYPLLMASDRESFRLHYAPSFAHFIQNRALPSELRTLAAQYETDGCTIHFGASDEMFVMGGWGGIEGETRWALNREASILLPIAGAADRVIRFHALPIGGEDRVRVSLDGVLLGEMPMPRGWHDYELVAPKSAWRGDRHVLTFQFNEAIVPAAVDRTSKDTRALSALFESVSVAPAGQPAPPAVPQHRIALHLFPRGDDGPADAKAFRRLTARLGFEADVASRASVENMAESLLDRSVCSDDATFLRDAYWSLVGRDIDESYAKSVVSHWTSRRERAWLIHGIMRTPEFPVARAK